MKRVRFAALAAFSSMLVAAGCATTGGPEASALAYARALDEGRVKSAYAMLSTVQREEVSFEEFSRWFADAAARRHRAKEIVAGLDRFASQELDLVREPEGWRVVERAPALLQPRAALESFLDAVERRDFATAYGLLSRDWRARYTPARLEADFEREPLARERLARARAALDRLIWSGETAVVPLGEERQVVLVREDTGFKVARIE